MSDEYYKILGVSKGVSKGEIKKAFRALAKLYHPDRNVGDAVAEEKFREINEAYSYLKVHAEENKNGGGKAVDFDEDYYSMLGVRKGASREEIEREYNKLMEQFVHEQNTEEALEKIKKIKKAYEVIKDESPPDVW